MAERPEVVGEGATNALLELLRSQSISGSELAKQRIEQMIRDGTAVVYNGIAMHPATAARHRGFGA